MNIELIVVGKTDSKEVNALVENYTKRINFYNRFNITYIPDVKNTKSLSEAQQKTSEGEAIMRLLDPSDRVVLLDEKGSEFRSVEYADWLQKRLNSGVKRLVFIIGGPYGFSPEIYSRANEKISLSKMTFSHQIIRAIFTEQLYRAFSILHNSPYHHEWFYCEKAAFAAATSNLNKGLYAQYYPSLFFEASVATTTFWQ